MQDNAVTKPVLHVIEDNAKNLSLSIGITPSRAEFIQRHVERTFYDALVYPYTTDRPQTVAHILHQVSTVCENMQELAYAMYKSGTVYKTYMAKEEEKKREATIMPFIFGKQPPE